MIKPQYLASPRVSETLSLTAVAQILISPRPLERLQIRGLGEPAQVGTPGPGGVCAVSALRTGSPVIRSPQRQRKDALSGGTRSPQPRAICNPGAGCSVGTRRPGAGSGGNFSRGERKAGLVTRPRASQPRVPHYRQTSSFFSCRAIRMQAFRN